METELHDFAAQFHVLYLLVKQLGDQVKHFEESREALEAELRRIEGD